MSITEYPLNNSNMLMPKQLFVTGTDTDIGKTVVSAALCSGLSAGYWKPVQAGLDPMTDTERVRSWTNLPDTCFYPERHCLKLPMSPHAASEDEGILIALDDFTLPLQRQDHLIVEGAGGLMVPLNRQHMILDLIRKLEIPVLLVASSGLGTINHTLMSMRLLEQSGAKIWGVVLNGKRNFSNEDAIRHFGKTERLFAFPPLNSVTPENLKISFRQTFLEYAS